METAKRSVNTKHSGNFSSIEDLSNLAITKHKGGQIEEAIALYLKIIALNPHQPHSLYINLISLMIKLDMLDRAVQVVNQGLTIHPDSDEIYRTLGMIFGQKGELDRSVGQYKRALQIESLQPEWVFINLAKTLLHTNQLEEALSVCQAGFKFYAQSEYLIKIQHKISGDRGDLQQVNSLLTNSNAQDCFKAQNVFWLNEQIVYLECKLNKDWDLSSLEVSLLDKNFESKPKIYYFAKDKSYLSFIVVFAESISVDRFDLLLVSSERQANMEVKIAGKAFGLELTDYINSQPSDRRYRLQENICYGIINNTSENQVVSSQELIKKIQSFIKIESQFCNNINEPFSIYFDLVIPIHCQGLFINGWMSDPWKMLEEINAISSLGFTIPIKDAIHYVKRPDINKAINNTPYKGTKKQHGILAYIPFSKEIKRKFAAYAQQHNFRFTISLKGNINHNVIPKTTYYQGNSGMAHILNSFTNHKNNISLLKKCIAPAALAIVQSHSQESAEIDIQTIGKSIPHSPLASIVIPINKNFELMKVQFAMMANDNSIRNSELIYILSSGELRHKWSRILESYSYLYDVPVKLITTDLGNDYGALINLGAAEAKSDLCISMLPDVLPKTDNWVGKMADFHHSLSNPGVLTPKLIYEDLSIQHAGMTYEQIHTDSWDYKHFYRGLPSTYPPAQKSRSIPSTNGACMMFSRQLHQEINGLSAEYLTPESEAFDFCLKSLELGYENWYLAEVEMYFFEKQNYFTEFINHYNLESQSKNWHGLMTKFSNETA